MSDPASITGTALAAGAITITGSILGVQYDALLMGFIGGVIILSFLPQMSVKAVFGTLFTSSILGGVMAPLASSTIAHFVSYLDFSGDAVRMASALLVGVSAQTVIPVFLKWAKQLGGSR